MLPNRLIDLRSDTVTRPSPAMRSAMADAEVGDDVYGEDPTVNRLEAVAARRLGTESAVFVSSGTQGNLIALLAHCERGDEYLVGERMHSFRSEAGGAAVLGGIQPQPLPVGPDGRVSPEAFEAAIKPDDFHYARSRLICLENTLGGRALPVEYLAEVAVLARRRGLLVHLDGARIFNAAVKLGVTAPEIAGHADSVTFCLSKGLGAPVGSVLCGGEKFIRTARRLRKLLGGGTRQAGVLAAAGLYALEHNVERLAEDHANARRLATGLDAALRGNPHVAVDLSATETNMTFLDVAAEHLPALVARLREQGILISARNPVRLVTHLDVTSEDIDAAVAATAAYFDAGRPESRAVNR